MSCATQVKLLRVIEHGKVRRVGGRSDHPVDVRVIASTNQTLEFTPTPSCSFVRTGGRGVSGS